MGKKRIIQKSEEELLKERDKVDSLVKKESSKSSRRVKDGRVYIFSSYNNTVLTLTDLGGNVLAWTSAGKLGFKGAKKATPFAASKVAEAITQSAQKLGLEKIEIFVRGVGGGRESAVRSLVGKGFDVALIKDITPIPHNGVRSPKPRRV